VAEGGASSHACSKWRGQQKVRLTCIKCSNNFVWFRNRLWYIWDVSTGRRSFEHSDDFLGLLHLRQLLMEKVFRRYRSTFRELGPYLGEQVQTNVDPLGVPEALT
jgi:hypothetical protein